MNPPIPKNIKNLLKQQEAENEKWRYHDKEAQEYFDWCDAVLDEWISFDETQYATTGSFDFTD